MNSTLTKFIILKSMIATSALQKCAEMENAGNAFIAFPAFLLAVDTSASASEIVIHNGLGIDTEAVEH